MRITTLLLGFCLLACSLSAQTNDFDKKARVIRRLLTGKDTVLYNGTYLETVRLHQNGNIRLKGTSDSLAFNLLLLKQVWLDKDSTYNQYGLHLDSNRLLLLVEGTSESIEFNEKNEISVVRKMLPVFELKFSDSTHAIAAAKAFIQLRALCTPDKNSLQPPGIR